MADSSHRARRTGRSGTRLQRVEALLRRLRAALAVTGGAALAVLLGFTVAAVFRRYVLNDPIFGDEDVAAMTLAVVVAMAVAYAAYGGSHVCVNVIGRLAGRRTTRVTDAAARVLGLAAIVVTVYALFAKGSCGLPCGAATANLSIPHAPFYYTLGAALAACGALLAVHLLLGFACWNGDDPNAPGE